MCWADHLSSIFLLMIFIQTSNDAKLLTEAVKNVFKKWPSKSFDSLYSSNSQVSFLLLLNTAIFQGGFLVFLVPRPKEDAFSLNVTVTHSRQCQKRFLLFCRLPPLVEMPSSFLRVFLFLLEDWDCASLIWTPYPRLDCSPLPQASSSLRTKTCWHSSERWKSQSELCTVTSDLRRQIKMLCCHSSGTHKPSCEEFSNKVVQLPCSQTFTFLLHLHFR